MRFALLVLILTLVLFFVYSQTAHVAFSMAEEKGVVGYYLVSQEVGWRIYVTVVLYSMFMTLAAVLGYFISLAAAVAPSRERKLALTSLARFYSLLSLTALVLLAGVIALIVMDRSDTPVTVAGLTLHIYPASLGLGYALGGLAALQLLLFYEYRFAGRLRTHVVGPFVACFLLMLLLSFLPENWYGGAPKLHETLKTYSVREITSLLVTLLFVIPVVLLIRAHAVEKSRESDRIRRLRLSLFISGLVVFLGFFVFMVLDALAGVPYTLWMIPAYVCAMLGLLMMYLSILPPRWLMARWGAKI